MGKQCKQCNVELTDENAYAHCLYCKKCKLSIIKGSDKYKAKHRPRTGPKSRPEDLQAQLYNEIVLGGKFADLAEKYGLTECALRGWYSKRRERMEIRDVVFELDLD
jgi:hypothetical protein